MSKPTWKDESLPLQTRIIMAQERLVAHTAVVPRLKAQQFRLALRQFLQHPDQAVDLMKFQPVVQQCVEYWKGVSDHPKVVKEYMEFLHRTSPSDEENLLQGNLHLLDPEKALDVCRECIRRLSMEICGILQPALAEQIRSFDEENMEKMVKFWTHSLDSIQMYTWSLTHPHRVPEIVQSLGFTLPEGLTEEQQQVLWKNFMSIDKCLTIWPILQTLPASLRNIILRGGRQMDMNSLLSTVMSLKQTPGGPQEMWAMCMKIMALLQTPRMQYAFQQQQLMK